MDAEQTGYYEARYYTSPAQVQTQFDFPKSNGENWTHMHVVETNLVGMIEEGESESWIIFGDLRNRYRRPGPHDFSTSIWTNRSSPSMDRLSGDSICGKATGFSTAGYTSVATFDGLFLPVQPELVVGGGYSYPLTENSSITGSFYDIRIPSRIWKGVRERWATCGTNTVPSESFWFTADLGISHGIGAAGQLHYVSERDTILALARYMPEQFASLGANNLRGLHTDLSWSRHVTKEFEADLTFYNNNACCPG